MTPRALEHAPYYVLAAVIAAAAGVLLAWWLRRRTMVSIRNVYLLAAAAIGVDVALLYEHVAIALRVMVPLTAFTIAAAAIGRRWRLSDLGAGEELRAHERARRWLWQPAVTRAAGERVHIVSQGQLMRDRAWPASEPFVPLTARLDGPRVPRSSGRHVFCVGATGSGKTTSALRAAAGRAVKDRTALLFVDQKGDPLAERVLRALAATTGVPFIVLDPDAADSDRWQPLWGERPAEVVARVLAGIQTSEPYYADVLRQHVGLVASVLYAGGYWPPSMALLIAASQRVHYARVLELARAHRTVHPDLYERVSAHAAFVVSAEGEKALAGGLVRLDLVMGEAWRTVLTPRTDSTGTPVAVSIADAISERAIVLWRTHVDRMPDEAKTITAVILNDIHAAAAHAQAAGPAPWTCVLDEFGAVVETAADQVLALLQRGRTHDGQVHVITQSVADIEALTGKTGLLASMADNFAGFIVHRQTAPESRDWLAKLMGTDALWQSTDRTSGQVGTGEGSRRRVREFRVGSDTFAELAVGHAVVHTTLGPRPALCAVRPLQLPDDRALQRIGTAERSPSEMIVHPALQLPAAPTRTKRKTTAAAKGNATKSPAAATTAANAGGRRARLAPRDEPPQPPPAQPPPLVDEVHLDELRAADVARSADADAPATSSSTNGGLNGV